ncbi:hypothetical protein SOVF_137600 [Spinacia oleracea]|uniref:protein-serine/threonine phosphatase n=1 Tax=Spinacia oleracea TaxID=3562 RepID=A0A9R0IGQ1_SPIOL|nr:RNA polymerase II C-terminal domain phosphatase-like 4 [Spinacia oleracea]KNA11133.1 hypothetical protein SOVF_137600 [Spinacia oleracea]
MCEVLSIDNNRGRSHDKCEHTAFINNSCAWCKKTLQDCNDPTTVPFRYIDPNFSLTVDAIRHLRDRNFKTLVNRKKLHLVLDLDNTLIHSISTTRERITLIDRKKIKTVYKDVYEILGGDRLVKVRPGARSFLEQATALFDLSIYTMAGEDYAKEVSRVLRSKVCEKRVRFETVISNEHSTKPGRKGLDVVLSHEPAVLIVDDLVEVWRDEHKGNVINIKPYKFFKKRRPWVTFVEDDQELPRVLSILRKVHEIFYVEDEGDYAGKDVRQILNKIQIESPTDGLLCGLLTLKLI